MKEHRSSVEEMSEVFRIFADAEGERIPTYARLCRIIADDPELAGLLLEAPVGQRLPVLLLAALHDVVLRQVGAPLQPWYPSVTDTPPPPADPIDALYETVERFRGELLDLLRTRQVQTNEVNRCTGWWLGLHDVCAGDPRPLCLVEVGSSAGLNLRINDYAYEFAGAGVDGRVFGHIGSSVRLSTRIRTGPWPGLDADLPAVHSSIGIDQNPLVVMNEADSRWLRACVWPEQKIRFDRLDAALSRARADPPTVIVGDLVDDLMPVLESRPNGTHVVVFDSWVLAYVSRERRELFGAKLADAARSITAGGGRLTLLSFEAESVIPWMAVPPRDPDAPAEIAYASIMSATSFDTGEPVAVAMARCQAHLNWVDRLDRLA